MGTHPRVLCESYPMNTNMTGFRWFSKIFASMCFESALEGYWVRPHMQQGICYASMPGVRPQVHISTGSLQAGWLGRYENVQHCGGLSMVLLQP